MAPDGRCQLIAKRTAETVAVKLGQCVPGKWAVKLLPLAKLNPRAIYGRRHPETVAALLPRRRARPASARVTKDEGRI